MIQETIAQLTGHLKFVVDSRPLREFERNLARVQTKLNQFAKTANQKIQFKPMLNANVMAQQKGAFQQLMQQAKLQRITNDNAHRSVMANMKQQHQAAMGNAKLQLANARIQQQAAIAGARLTAATAAAERRAQAARLTMNQRIAAATTRQRRLDELHAIRVQRAQLGLQRAQAASRAGGGGFGGVGVNAGAIASMMPGGGFSSLISGSGAAAAGLGALAGATAGAIIGLRMLATEAQKAGDWQAHASAQMKVFDSQAVQQNMEWLFNIANDLGVSARDTQQGVMRALIGMRDGGMSTNAAKQSTYDVMAYARASGLDTATVDLVFRAMGQMLSKG
ncbi:TPA: tape measure domain-containing protein, partial [Pseudomonas aeruginosa]|nr:tape measure domain-containing protein [Pseudomonas aeruginosa]